MNTEIINQNEMHKQLLKAAGAGNFTPNMRIAQAMSNEVKSGKAKYRDYYIGQGSALINLGNQVEAIIGPWRYHALRIKDGQIDLEDFNITKSSRYNAATNNWECPDGFTPNFLEIMHKKVPDRPNMELTNMSGYDFLLWVPSINDFVIFFLAKTAFSMTDTADVCLSNKGRLSLWDTQIIESKRYDWPAPKVSIIPNSDIVIPETGENLEKIEKFLNPGVIYDPSNTQAKER